jgi:hypothetical protein
MRICPEVALRYSSASHSAVPRATDWARSSGFAADECDFDNPELGELGDEVERLGRREFVGSR